MGGEEFFERGAYFGNMGGCDLPYDVEIHICVIVCHDVAHAAHFAERQLGNALPGGFAQMSNGFANDFYSPDYSILFLPIGAEAVSVVSLR